MVKKHVKDFTSSFYAQILIWGDPGKSSIDPPHPPIQGYNPSNPGQILRMIEGGHKENRPLPHSPFPTIK